MKVNKKRQYPLKLFTFLLIYLFGFLFLLTIVFSKFESETKNFTDLIDQRISQFEFVTALYSLHVSQYNLYSSMYFLNERNTDWYMLKSGEGEVLFEFKKKLPETYWHSVISRKIQTNGIPIATLYLQINKVEILKQVLNKEWLVFSFLILMIVIFSIVIFWMNHVNLSRYTSILNLLSQQTGVKIEKITELETSVANTSDVLTRSFLKNIIDIFKHYLNLQQELVVKSKQAAIAQTTSMLAHDVRKPFTLVQTVLNSFDYFAKDENALNEAKQEVSVALKRVESMITDIMDYSREVKVETKPISLPKLIHSVLYQMFQEEQSFCIEFNYKLNASYKPFLDEDRLARVVTNIINNGVEAITVLGKKNKGIIDIQTVDIDNQEGASWVELIIGNDGPIFPQGVEDKLFESFYTSGKPKGTGLGLASAKKIVDLHKGTILARNKLNGNGVEFVITIPASRIHCESDDPSLLLPPTNHDAFSLFKKSNVTSRLNNNQMKKIEDISPNATKTTTMSLNPVVITLTSESSLSVVNKEQVYKILQSFNRPIRILLLEDEPLYRVWVHRLVENDDILKQKISIYDTSRVSEALQLVRSQSVDMAIIDIDLNDAQSGFDFLDAISDQIQTFPCLIHSNRTLPEALERARLLGVKSFAPKPLSLEVFFDFLERG